MCFIPFGDSISLLTVRFENVHEVIVMGQVFKTGRLADWQGQHAADIYQWYTL
jgi:hypothetical protein